MSQATNGDSRPARPGLPVWLLIVGVFLLLSGLSFWQWQRGEEKAVLLARLAARAALPALAWAEASRSSVDVADRQIRLTGRFLPDYRVALDNRMHQGRAGLDIYMAFLPEGSDRAVLVDIGWVPTDRDNGPAVPRRVPPVTALSGHVRLPSPFITFGGPELRDGLWRVGRLEPGLWAARWRQDLMPWVLEPSAALSGGHEYTGLAAPTVVITPERHRAYAFQWAALALAWLACWGFAWRRLFTERGDD